MDSRGAAAIELQAYGTWDAFVARCRPDGTFAWAGKGTGGRFTAGYGIAGSTARVLTGAGREGSSSCARQHPGGG